MKTKFLIIIFCTINTTTYPQNYIWDLLRFFPHQKYQATKYPSSILLRHSPLLQNKFPIIKPPPINHHILHKYDEEMQDACPCGHPIFEDEQEECTCCGLKLKSNIPSPIEFLKNLFAICFKK